MPVTILDSFENQAVAPEWNNTVAGGPSPQFPTDAADGTYSFHLSGASSYVERRYYSDSFSNLPVNDGVPFGFWVKAAQNAYTFKYFGVVDATQDQSGHYTVAFTPGSTFALKRRNTDGSENTISQTTSVGNVAVDSWAFVQTEWNPNGTIRVSVRDSPNGTEYFHVNGTDTTYTSGGTGFGALYTSGQYVNFDGVQVLHEPIRLDSFENQAVAPEWNALVTSGGPPDFPADGADGTYSWRLPDTGSTSIYRYYSDSFSDLPTNDGTPWGYWVKTVAFAITYSHFAVQDATTDLGDEYRALFSPDSNLTLYREVNGNQTTLAQTSNVGQSAVDSWAFLHHTWDAAGNIRLSLRDGPTGGEHFALTATDTTHQSGGLGFGAYNGGGEYSQIDGIQILKTGDTAAADVASLSAFAPEVSTEGGVPAPRTASADLATVSVTAISGSATNVDPSVVIENVEDGGLAEYVGDTAGMAPTTGIPAANGTWSLHTTSNSGPQAITSHSGLGADAYFGPGSYDWNVQIIDSGGGSPNGRYAKTGILFAVPSGETGLTGLDGFEVRVETTDDTGNAVLSIREWVNGNDSVLNSQTFSLTFSSWHDVHLDWGTSSLAASVSSGGTTLASTSTATVPSSGATGLGWYGESGDNSKRNAYVDYLRGVGLAQTATAGLHNLTLSTFEPVVKNVVPAQTATATTATGLLSAPSPTATITTTGQTATVAVASLLSSVEAPSGTPGSVTASGELATATTSVLNASAVPGAVTTTTLEANGTLAAPTPSVGLDSAPQTATTTVATGSLTQPAAAVDLAGITNAADVATLTASSPLLTATPGTVTTPATLATATISVEVPALTPGAVVSSTDTAVVALQQQVPSLLLGTTSIAAATASVTLTAPQPTTGAGVSVTLTPATTTLVGIDPTVAPGSVTIATDAAVGAIQAPLPSMTLGARSLAAASASVDLTASPATSTPGPVAPTVTTAAATITAPSITTGSGVVVNASRGTIVIQGIEPGITRDPITLGTEPLDLGLSVPSPDTISKVTVTGISGHLQTQVPSVTGLPGPISLDAESDLLVLSTVEPTIRTGFLVAAIPATASASVGTPTFLAGPTTATVARSEVALTTPGPQATPGPVGAIAATSGLSVSTVMPGLEAVFYTTAEVGEIFSSTSQPSVITRGVTGTASTGTLSVTGPAPEAVWDLAAALDPATLALLGIDPEVLAGFPTEAVLAGAFDVTALLYGQSDPTAALGSEFATDERLAGRENRPESLDGDHDTSERLSG